MKRVYLIAISACFLVSSVKSQQLTMDDLVTLSDLSPRSADNYLNKRGYLHGNNGFDNDVLTARFFEKTPKTPDSSVVVRSVDLFRRDGFYCIEFHTSSVEEYKQGQNWLKKAGFFYNREEDSTALNEILFQRKDITVLVNSSEADSILSYNFLVQKRKFPGLSAVRFAEDLLNFDSHEHLAYFFGEKNVKKDVYYFSDKELKKCSILYPNTDRQAIFIWEDEAEYCKLSYVLISGVSPTSSGQQFEGGLSQNSWRLRNGLYSNMSIRELLRVNGEDFSFYGSNSEFSFMISPASKGNIDFKKTAIMLGCLNCAGTGLIEKNLVSGVDALNNNLSLHIFYIMISP